MPREKILRNVGREFHQYTEKEWKLLKEFRKKAIEILEILEHAGIKAFVHGSVARGDINEASDIDIHIPIQIPSFKLDLIKDMQFTDHQIMMGTPNSTIRAVLSLKDSLTISFPLSNPVEREDEFYRFSGLLYLEDLLLNRRVAGVTKQLLLIEPEEEGYWYFSIDSNKKRAIQILSLSQRIIDERIRVLTRRDKLGRTGLFLDYSLTPDENFESALKNLADRNVIVRRMLKRRS
ncbi:MAG: nucleotidyltransferase domain-containing protein [Candidatus Heimdallarchaeota archaeon]|nr:MAG: nucleotidyltransferase domain-containing protein [Candidatus Heimdallarchaeota archaeon]